MHINSDHVYLRFADSVIVTIDLILKHVNTLDDTDETTCGFRWITLSITQSKILFKNIFLNI